MTTDTKNAEHRTLIFKSFDDVLAELERIETTCESGDATTSGNWTIGENCDHCAKFIRFACDGFESKAPAPIRFVFRLLFFKKVVGPEPMPRGFKLPKSASSLLPDNGITDGEGIAELRQQLKRVLAGKDMTQPSPIFGSLTHEQWLTVQLKHCAMHLGFIHYPDQSTP